MSVISYRSSRLYTGAPYSAIDPQKPTSSATGRATVITGGATGIGLAMARNFAIAGASTIVLLARREETLQRAFSELSATFPNIQFLVYAVSITDETGIQKVFSSVRQDARNKDIDVLVTSAALAKADKPLSKTPSLEVKAIFETNVFGNLNVGRQGPYGASKDAFSFLMHHVQIKHPELHVYTLHPGAVCTQAGAAAGMTEDMFDWNEEDLPGQFVVWLAGQEADFLKGKFLASHWDVTELMAKKEALALDADLSTIGLRR
ncbi:hypothetical protein N7532_003202 [Penicillium argentinense]|uniref:NAD(P)-binding protein n=1 Tax=Penicillium argentinense TaxID=1131581 RepID=A0A9W9KEF2_9EURO|nr:uncharacterized protein N7532_003202 [Penicillium argentinense]KAJ5102673.1 hypothetical protein N7532_003202 [Penicillium argentinense]